MTNANENRAVAIRSAWVIFSGHADMAWLKILKPGFRHCSVLMNDGHSWISYDPLSNYTDITVHRLPAEFNLPRWMQERGHTVLPASMNKPKRPAPFSIFSCVEAVKRSLGIHARLVITPWQLYRHLIASKDQLTLTGDFAWEA